MSAFRHTNESPVCPSCADKLLSADPKLRDWFNEVVKEQFPDCHVSWAFRGQADQDLAVKEGKSKLTWPHSKHNFCGPDGTPMAKAIDLFQLDDSNIAAWPWRYFKSISGYLDPGMSWGGDWTTFKDSDHYELD